MRVARVKDYIYAKKYFEFCHVPPPLKVVVMLLQLVSSICEFDPRISNHINAIYIYDLLLCVTQKATLLYNSVTNCFCC